MLFKAKKTCITCPCCSEKQYLKNLKSLENKTYHCIHCNRLIYYKKTFWLVSLLVFGLLCSDFTIFGALGAIVIIGEAIGYVWSCTIIIFSFILLDYIVERIGKLYKLKYHLLYKEINKIESSCPKCGKQIDVDDRRDLGDTVYFCAGCKKSLYLAKENVVYYDNQFLVYVISVSISILLMVLIPFIGYPFWPYELIYLIIISGIIGILNIIIFEIYIQLKRKYKVGIHEKRSTK